MKSLRKTILFSFLPVTFARTLIPLKNVGDAITGVSKEVTSSIESIKGEIDLFKV